MRANRLGAALAAALLAGTAQAYRPSGWLWFLWPYAYDSVSKHWVYLNVADQQWCFGFPPGAGWSLLMDSGVAQGWSWHLWPYAYDFDQNSWHYFNESDTQWCRDMTTGQWSKLGRLSPPATMAPVPAGDFQMGDAFGEGDLSEGPVHTVYVSALHMDRCEITQAQWNEVYAWATAHGYALAAGWSIATNHPAQQINWFDCVKWCNARSEREGRTPAYYTSAAKTQVYRTGQVAISNDWVRWNAGYRLPTEAEWEKAARGGAVGRRFPWSDTDTIQHARANYFSTTNFAYDTSPTRGYHPSYAGTTTSPVGAFAPNDYGLHDMCGNAWEWTWNWGGEYPAGSETDPRGPAAGTVRMLRGAAAGNDAEQCRVAYRNGGYADQGTTTVGLRTVLPTEP